MEACSHLADAAQVVAHEVHDHEVLCTVLLRGHESLGGRLVSFGVIRMALGSALDGPCLQPAILACLQKPLWR